MQNGPSGPFFMPVPTALAGAVSAANRHADTWPQHIHSVDCAGSKKPAKAGFLVQDQR